MWTLFYCWTSKKYATAGDNNNNHIQTCHCNFLLFITIYERQNCLGIRASSFVKWKIIWCIRFGFWSPFSRTQKLLQRQWKLHVAWSWFTEFFIYSTMDKSATANMRLFESFWKSKMQKTSNGTRTEVAIFTLLTFSTQ